MISEDKQKGFDLIIKSGKAVRDFYNDANGNFDEGAYAAAETIFQVTLAEKDKQPVLQSSILLLVKRLYIFIIKVVL